ncbi:hypothetical protein [Trinickia fusca]|uniref:Uncharacterized protein n=1 Tax=Trinickia fusca TaxID=2419777 RepID=A0A494XU68_9BURK|nr:hypothetical protein [Trinickia fusca]RKP51083.1 hypothetical protein D7S89_08545 [Trinickia fusca]
MTSEAARHTFADAMRIFAPDLVVRLTDMPHYGGPLPTDDKVRLAAGYFYNFSTRPSDGDIDAALNTRGGVLIPSVRAAKSRMLKHHFVRTAEHVECVATFEASIDRCLSDRLGARRACDIRRLARKAGYGFEMLEASQLDETHWADLARLDALHNARHATATPMFCEAVQRKFAGSPLAHDFRWIFRRDASGRVVQTGLILLGRQERTVYYLNQSIDRASLAPGQNLYVATFYALYCWSQANGFHAVHLGRDGAAEKQRLGADVFIPQSHWLKQA